VSVREIEREREGERRITNWSCKRDNGERRKVSGINI